jgi:hypothetical protein
MHKLDNQADAIKRPVETIAKFRQTATTAGESRFTETEETWIFCA